VGSDGLGFLTISPQCSGNCQVHLSYNGGAEMRVMRWLSLLTVMAAAAWFVWKRAIVTVRP
jgi:hypothetical protein